MFLTTYEAVVAGLLCGRFAGHLLRVWASGQIYLTKRPGYEFTTHTSSTVQQSTPVLNKKYSLKTVMVDVLFGVPEARTWKQSRTNKMRPLSSCLLHNLTNAVYIKRSYPSPSASTMCIFILAYCLPWAVVISFQHTARHLHFPRLCWRDRSVGHR